MHQKGSTEAFWAEAMKRAADVYNRRAMQELNMRTPMEALLGTASNNSRLHIFRCETYYQVHKANRESKFVEKAEKVVYLGNDHGLYRIYIPVIQSILTTKHALFDERVFRCRNTKTVEMRRTINN